MADRDGPDGPDERWKTAIRAVIPLFGFIMCRSFIPTTMSLTLDSPVIRNAPTIPPSSSTGKLPALGWNTWNAYRCNISEEKILAAGQQFVDLGLQRAGYEYVNIDDCWSAKSGRDPNTKRIVPDSAKFPNGIDQVASKIHDLGLKIGIYSDAGTKTCAGYPGSLGNEFTDASTFADWGIDYLKYDNCNVPHNWTDKRPPNNDWYYSYSAIRFRQMTAALANQSRPIQYDLCIWGDARVWEWGAKVGHSWRITPDSTPTWDFILDAITTNVDILNRVDFYSHNDMDMMEIGNGKLTLQEERTHFAAWAFMKSPILLGTDLGNLSQVQLGILQNPEILAFHQDAMYGQPAMPFKNAGSLKTSPPEYYSGQSVKGLHVFVINLGDRSSEKSINFTSVPGLGYNSSGLVLVHDMWTGQDIGLYRDSYNFSMEAHDTAAFALHLPSVTFPVQETIRSSSRTLLSQIRTPEAITAGT
ncbi:glycoside hydrolase [Rickenella mellea]|uniref:Alpha-galactosidase n=1 Tax=Rickenella mellea TaxID=50990 RepID=A0A4Y7PKZ0_9AGAM|nr:glycoside hydrolase [Rickenella mellea]